MSWGYRIFILYTGFVAGMLFLVYKCVQEDVDLVTPDYYAKELKFQDQIDRMNNNEKSGNRLQISFNAATNSIDIEYPENEQGKIKGEILMFRPDNSKLDFSIPVQPLNGKQVISAATLAKGYWRIQTTWEHGDTPLYQEERIYVQ
jgi:hypothetical protein